MMWHPAAATCRLFTHQCQATKSLARCFSSQLAEIRDQLGQFRAGTVELEKKSDVGIAVLTLNNPSKKNALSELSQWKEGKGLILQGANNTFCSGGDLTMVSAILNSRDGERMAQFMHDTLSRLHALPLMSVALLEGVAVGGGAELATACDTRFMTKAAKIGFVQIRMGVTTGWGGATRLYRLLGRQKTLRLFGSGKVLTADEASALGLVDYVLPADSCPLETAQTLLLENYCRGDTEIVRKVKDMIVNIENNQSLQDSLVIERKVFATVWGGDTQKAALQQNIKHS